MNKSIKIGALVSALAIISSSANAESGFYAGGGLSFGTALSNVNPANVNPVFMSTDTGAAVGVTAGYRYQLEKSFAAVEIDADIFLSSDFESVGNGLKCTVGANAPYFCKRNSTIRLRGVYGVEVSDGLELFGALGVGIVNAQLAVGGPPAARISSSNTGITYGLGLQKTLSPTGKLRAEIIVDRFNTNRFGTFFGSAPQYQAVSVKIGYMHQF